MALTKKHQYRANALITVLATLGVLILMNILAQEWFYRFDLTEENRYSLSPASQEAVANLDDTVTVKVFMNSDVSQFQALFRYVQDFLEEYQHYSNGKFEFSVVDPGRDPEAKTEALQLGIVPAQLSIRSSQGASVREIYSGMAVYYRDRHEIIDQIFSTDIEYDLTSTIQKLTRAQIPKIAFVSGHEEHALDGDYSVLEEELRKSFDVEPIMLSSSENSLIDPAIYQLLVVAGPKTDFSVLELYSIDQYVMHGGKVIFLLDAVNEMEGAIQGIRSNIQDLVSSYGVEYHTAILVDPTQNFAQPLNQLFSRPAPWIPKITSFADHPIVKKVNLMYVPLSGYLTVGEGSTTWTELAWTSPTSWAEIDEAALSSGQLNQDPGVDPTGPFAVAVGGIGSLQSHFVDQPLPEGIQKDQLVSSSPPDTRMLVVGNGQMLTNQNLQQLPGNLTFFTHGAEWLISGTDVASIQTREVKERPLKDVSAVTREWIRYLNILGMAILVTSIGLVRWVIRRRRKKSYLIEM